MIARRRLPVKQNPQSFLHPRKIAENHRKTQKRCKFNLQIGCGLDRQNDLKWLPLRSSHIQRKYYFYFGIAERLRTLRYPIFTGGVVKANGIYNAASSGSAAERIPNHPAQKERRRCRSFLLSPGRDCAILIPDKTKVYLKVKKRYQIHENSRKRFYPRRQVPCR